MKRIFSALVLTLLATPAAATSGLVCQTASGPPTSFAFTFASGGPVTIAAVSRFSGGRWIQARVGQSWISDRSFNADLIDTDLTHSLARIETKRKGRVYDGTIIENGHSRWIRCREG